MKNIEDGIKLEGKNTEIDFSRKDNTEDQMVETPKNSIKEQELSTIEKLKQENALLKKDIEKLKGNLKILPDGTIVVNGDNSDNVAMYEDRINDLNIFIKKKEAEITRLNNIIESINKSKENLINGINDLKNDKEKLLNELDEQDQNAKAKIKELLAEKEALNNTIKELSQEINQAANSNDSEEIKNLNNTINKFICDNNKITECNEMLTAENNLLKQKLDQLENELLKRDDIINNLKSEVALINKHNDMVHDHNMPKSNKFTIDEIIKLLVALKRENLL